MLVVHSIENKRVICARFYQSVAFLVKGFISEK